MRVSRWMLEASFGAAGTCALFWYCAIGAQAAGDDGTLTGRVLGADGPIEGAEVAAGIIGWAPAAGDFVVTSQSGAEGRFSLARAPLGPIDVWVRPAGGKWTFGIRMFHPGVNDIALDARPRRGMGEFGFGEKRKGVVTGVVTDKSGKPLARAAAGLRGDDATWVLTDDKGQFTLNEAADGDGLVVRADGFRDFVGEVKAEKKRLTVKLEAGKTTVVHVNDPAGAPVEGAWVVLGDPDRVQSTTGFSSLFPPRSRLVGAWTDAKGDARVVWGDTDDATVATAWALGFASATKKASSGRPVTLQLAAMQPVRATVTLRGSSEPLAGVYVGLPHESDGGADAISALPQDAQRGPVVVGLTDANGQCVVPHLPAGVLTLRVVGDMKIKSQVKLERLAVGGK